MAKLFKGIASVLLSITLLVAYTPTFSFAFDEAEDPAIEQAQTNEASEADEPDESAGEQESEALADPELEVEPIPAPEANDAPEVASSNSKSTPASDGSGSAKAPTRGSASEAAALTGLLVFSGVTPKKDNVLIRNASDSSYNDPRTVTFNPDRLDYELADVADNGKDASASNALTQLRFRPVVNVEGSTVTLKYKGLDGTAATKDITWFGSGNSSFANCLNLGSNELEIVVDPPEGTDLASTTYKIKVDCLPTLKELSLTQGGSQVYLDKDFASMSYNYSITVPSSVETIDVAATATGSGCTIAYNGSSSSAVDISDESVDSIDVAVSASKGSFSATNVYTIAIERIDSTAVGFNITPNDAMLSVYDSSGATVKPDADGKYTVMPGESLAYVASKAGYRSATGTIDGSQAMIDIMLEQGSSLPDVDSSWPYFRGDDSNMAIVDYETPVDVSLTDLIWVVALGENAGSGSFDNVPSVQIIVDNALVVLSNKTIYKLDLSTGEILAQGEMVERPNWGYTPPTYADGMIFAPLANGTIQAFNAKTLESVWVYKDPLKGQSLSPITYSEGCVYTGFWRSYTSDANYVCLTTTDEDPSSTNEQKSPSWRFSLRGGFYWAGAATIGDVLIIGTSNGLNDDSSTTTPAHILSIDKRTGQVVSSLDIAGTQRSSIAFDESTNQAYFVTKAGMLYRVDVDPATGALSNLKSANVGHDSTSTPVVYDGVVYFGCGDGFEQGYVMAYDSSTLKKIFEISAPGNVQSSLLLSTAYEDTGYIYLYFTYNNPPGGLGMLKVKNPPASASDAEYVDIYDATGYEQYNITSPIAGPDGTIYFKNDSGRVFAVAEISAVAAERAIDAIGEVTLESEGAINSARRIYDKLSEAEKAKVSNYDVLLAAEAKLAELKKEAEDKDKDKDQGGNSGGKVTPKPGGSTANGAGGYTRSLGLTLATKSSLAGVSAKAAELSAADKAAIARAEKLGHIGDAPLGKDNSGLLTWAVIGGAALLVLFLLLLLRRNNDDDEEEESAEGE